MTGFINKGGWVQQYPFPLGVHSRRAMSPPGPAVYGSRSSQGSTPLSSSVNPLGLSRRRTPSPLNRPVHGPFTSQLLGRA